MMLLVPTFRLKFYFKISSSLFKNSGYFLFCVSAEVRRSFPSAAVAAADDAAEAEQYSEEPEAFFSVCCYGTANQ